MEEKKKKCCMAVSLISLLQYTVFFLSFVICLCIQPGLDNMPSISQVGARQAVYEILREMRCCNMAGLTDKPPSTAQSQTRESWLAACRRSLVLLTQSLHLTQPHIYKSLLWRDASDWLRFFNVCV